MITSRGAGGRMGTMTVGACGAGGRRGRERRRARMMQQQADRDDSRDSLSKDCNVEDAKGVCVAVAYIEQKEGDVAQFMVTKELRDGLVSYLGSEGGEIIKVLGSYVYS
ncbi:hypothetical protein Tco_0892950 [Tanacetum coccineum]|uniref:Uncharacterized protein n=1 Tax=Tanacetum coccineum TaxID=301880 RepID=A0ABQ5CAC4_9ASTR